MITLSAMKDLFIELVDENELSDEELKAMGYDEEDIEAFKGYPND